MRRPRASAATTRSTVAGADQRMVHRVEQHGVRAARLRRVEAGAGPSRACPRRRRAFTTTIARRGQPRLAAHALGLVAEDGDHGGRPPAAPAARPRARGRSRPRCAAAPWGRRCGGPARGQHHGDDAHAAFWTTGAARAMRYHRLDAADEAEAPGVPQDYSPGRHRRDLRPRRAAQGRPAPPTATRCAASRWP